MDLYSPYLRFSTVEPGVFASPRFIETARHAGVTVVDIHPADLEATVHMARTTRGQPPTVGAVTLQMKDELWPLRQDLHPIPTDRVLGATDPVRQKDIAFAAKSQGVEVLDIRPTSLDFDELQRATYLAAGRRLALWFGSVGGTTLGLAFNVIESGARGEFSLPRIATYVGAGALAGTAGHRLLSRAKYRNDRPLLRGTYPLDTSRLL